jgi:Ca-activated chloride channel family protein
MRLAERWPRARLWQPGRTGVRDARESHNPVESHDLMHFAQPGWLWVLLLMPLPVLMERARPRIAWPSFDGFPPRFRIGWAWLRPLPAILRGLAIGSLAVALARPQTVGGTTRIAAQGIAIVVALDHSSSMNAADFPSEHGTERISRLKAAKTTFARFVGGRPDDLIGLVVFADYPDLPCPPVLDHAFLLETIESVRPARQGDDGTNIGDAIAWGLDALLAAPPKQKVLVLLTDGNNEPGVPQPLDPEEAATLVRDLGVTLHTIAIGPIPRAARGIDPDRERPATSDAEGPNLRLLEQLAKLTGGRSFAATDADALDEVFKTIDALEKSPVRGQETTRYHEHYGLWARRALALVLLSWLLSQGPLRRLP